MLFFQEYESRRRDIIVVISNSKKDDRGRFISQKRTISTNEFEHVNLIVQLDEIVVDQSEFLSIEKNQNDLNENDHNNQLKDSEQRNTDQIVRDQTYDDVDSSQSREFILNVSKYRREFRQFSMKLVYILQKIISASLIIIDDNIVNKKLSNFKKLIKDHVIVYDWIDKYKNYHVLNRHIIILHKRILHSKQYLVDKIINWFNILFDEFRKKWKFFKTIFFKRWNDFN